MNSSTRLVFGATLAGPAAIAGPASARHPDRVSPCGQAHLGAYLPASAHRRSTRPRDALTGAGVKAPT
jgi:hypothetical protein